MFWGQPYTPPQYYPMMYPQPNDSDRKEAIKLLKKQIKDLRAKDPKKEEKKDEKKKEIWKRAEFVALAFLTAPLLGSVYIGMLKLSWLLAQQLLNH